MNISNLLDHINNANDSYNEYVHESKRYYKEHGYGVNLDRMKTAEERHIGWLYHSNDREDTKMTGIWEVLDFDRDQIARAYTAARAIKRWYEQTEWQRMPSEDLLSRLNNFVIG